MAQRFGSPVAHVRLVVCNAGIMESMRESWTDERLDDLNAEVSGIKAEVVSLRGETRAGFERADDRFDALHRLLLQLGGILVAALIGTIATIGGVAISQL